MSTSTPWLAILSSNHKVTPRSTKFFDMIRCVTFQNRPEETITPPLTRPRIGALVQRLVIMQPHAGLTSTFPIALFHLPSGFMVSSRQFPLRGEPHYIFPPIEVTNPMSSHHPTPPNLGRQKSSHFHPYLVNNGKILVIQSVPRFGHAYSNLGDLHCDCTVLRNCFWYN